MRSTRLMTSILRSIRTSSYTSRKWSNPYTNRPILHVSGIERGFDLVFSCPIVILGQVAEALQSSGVDSMSSRKARKLSMSAHHFRYVEYDYQGAMHLRLTWLPFHRPNSFLTMRCLATQEIDCKRILSEGRLCIQTDKFRLQPSKTPHVVAISMGMLRSPWLAVSCLQK